MGAGSGPEAVFCPKVRAPSGSPEGPIPGLPRIYFGIVALDFVTCVYYCYQMNLKRLLWFLLLGFLVFFLVQAPGEAARLVKSTGENAGEWFSTAAEAFTKFLKSLA